MEEIPYKGWIIRPCPYQFEESRKWCAKVEIECWVGGSPHTDYREGTREFNSEEDARKISINMGKSWIDERAN